MSGNEHDLNQDDLEKRLHQPQLATFSSDVTKDSSANSSEPQVALKKEGKAELRLSQKKKWFLPFILSVAQYLDFASLAGLFLFTDPISADLGIKYETSTWILTAYAATFASFLLFFGRLSDLYSAKPVFAYGFAGVGILNLIISFMVDQYAFFVFRALSGIAGAATIPSAFRLSLATFDQEELHLALTLFGLSGAIASSTGLILAGLFGFITAGGQQAAWRWFFRMIAIVCIPFALLALALVPKTRGHDSGSLSPKDKLKRLDLPGSLTMLFAIILLILGLTLGTSYGWRTAKFLVPFLLSWPLFVVFFVYEDHLPEGYALMPKRFWRIPNMGLMLFVALEIYGWWNAGHCLEQQLSCLMIYSGGDIRQGGHWRWDLPAFLIGSSGAMIVFLGVNITVMTSVPAEWSGVAGAILQVALQVGAVVGLSIQAGLLTVHEGNVENFANVQVSFWFEFGWLMLNLLLIVLFFRVPRRADEVDEEKMVAVIV